MKLHLLLLLLLVPSALALGISPARITIGPEDTTFAFRPIADTAVNVKVEGDLTQHIILEQTVVQPGEMIRGSIRWPEEITPGPHEQLVVLSTVPAGAGFAGTAEVAGSLLVQVPYPDEYLDANWDITRDLGTGAALITVTVHNLGSRPVTPSAAVSIGDEVLVLPATNVAPASFSKVTGTFLPQSPGVYDAILEIRYAEQVFTRTRTESFGLPAITITDLTYNDEAGPIKPIDISGTVAWNRPLNATLHIYIDNSTALTESIIISNSFTHRAYVTTDTPTIIKAVILVEGVAATKEIDLTQEEANPLIIPLLAALIVLTALLIWLIWKQQAKPPKAESLIKQ